MTHKRDYSFQHLPFSLINESKQLPYIPTIIKNDKEKVKKEVLLFGENSRLISDFDSYTPNKRASLIGKRSSLMRLNDISRNNESLLNSERSQSRYSIKLKKLREKYSNSNGPGFFLTNMNKKNGDESLLNSSRNNNNNNSYSLSRISSGKRNKMSNKEKMDLFYSLEYLDLYSHNKMNALQNNIDNIENYEKKMIHKCHGTLKQYNDKYVIQSDEYLKEKIGNNDNLNLKFNQYFDKLISQNKEFDYIAINNLIKEKGKKELQKKINQMKIENKHQKFLKLINDEQNEYQKAKDLFEKVRKKQLNEINKYKMLRKRNNSVLN